MSKNNDFLKHGYQPPKNDGKYNPQRPINEGYQPITSTISQPPNIGTSVTKPKK